MNTKTNEYHFQEAEGFARLAERARRDPEFANVISESARHFIRRAQDEVVKHMLATVNLD